MLAWRSLTDASDNDRQRFLSERLRLDKIVAGLGQRGGSDSAEEAKMQKSEKQLQVKLKKGTIFYPDANTQAEGFFSSLHLSAHILGVLLPSGQMISISTSTSGPGRASLWKESQFGPQS